MPPSSARNSSWVLISVTSFSDLSPVGVAWSSDLPAEKSNHQTEKHHSVKSMLGLANQTLFFRLSRRLARDVNVVRQPNPRDQPDHVDSASVLA